jgi:hypothetical protein
MEREGKKKEGKKKGFFKGGVKKAGRKQYLKRRGGSLPIPQNALLQALVEV